MKTILPEGCEFRHYGDDMLFVGPLDRVRYLEIRKTLPPAILSRLIGWRRIRG